MKIIKRDFYLNQLIGVMEIPNIKVITEVRRSDGIVYINGDACHIITAPLPI